ncbi:MAG: hypothetical protein WCE81_03220 [Halobacteriota archaeon]
MSEENTSSLYSYVVRTDSGFAPNPFGGYCTLAYLPDWEEKSSCCKDIEKLILASNGNGFCRYQKVVKI